MGYKVCVGMLVLYVDNTKRWIIVYISIWSQILDLILPHYTGWGWKLSITGEMKDKTNVVWIKQYWSVVSTSFKENTMCKLIKKCVAFYLGKIPKM